MEPRASGLTQHSDETTELRHRTSLRGPGEVFSPREGTAVDLYEPSSLPLSKTGGYTTTDDPLTLSKTSLLEEDILTETSLGVKCEPAQMMRASNALTDRSTEETTNTTMVPIQPFETCRRSCAKARCSRSFTTVMAIPSAVLMLAVGVFTNQVVITTHNDVPAIMVETIRSLIATKVGTMVYTAELLDAMCTPRVTILEDSFTLSASC